MKYPDTNPKLKKMENFTFQEKVGKFLERYGNVKKLSEGNFEEHERILPFIVENEDQKFAVFAFHWKKSIGTNTIIRTEHRINDMNCDGAIIIGNRFSQNSYDMVSDAIKKGRKSIILIKTTELDEILGIDIA
ncbi:MAG: restriction endonuclease [Candidatus Heimdallarchaeota archaeon]|nr:restriction endonuclease [Candidatus Heimdallarchaeota archaeon]MCK4876862.1 restriction endonuclease [Candidatus Heimdallarchaeota archaeon]